MKTNTDTEISVTVYGYDPDGKLWGFTRTATITDRVRNYAPDLYMMARKHIRERAEHDLHEQDAPVQHVIWKEEPPP